MKSIKVFRTGLVAAVLSIALGYTACSDELDYDSPGDQSSGSLRNGSAVAVRDTLSGDSVQQYAGLVISKIYFTGSGYDQSGRTLINDQYIRITNNSDSPIDAANVVVLESKFTSASAYYGFSDSISDQNFVTEVIFRIPDAITSVLRPGQSLLLASLKQNYGSSGGIDLSCADYEWNGDSTSVYNLEKVFSYSQTTWVLHNRGFRSYAIGALPGGAKDTTDLINAGLKYTGTYHLDVGDTTYVMTTTNAYKIPNEWIIDAVNVVSPNPSERILHTLPYPLDWGLTYAGNPASSSDPARFQHVVTRNFVNNKYVDTNNSSNDFTPNDTPPDICGVEN